MGDMQSSLGAIKQRKELIASSPELQSYVRSKGWSGYGSGRGKFEREERGSDPMFQHLLNEAAAKQKAAPVAAAAAPATAGPVPVAPIEIPLNAETITPEQIGTLGENATKKKSRAPQGRLSTILSGVGDLSEKLGG